MFHWCVPCLFHDAEQCVNDVGIWNPGGDALVLATGETWRHLVSTTRHLTVWKAS